MPAFLANPHLLLATTAFLWGGNAVAGRFAVGHVSPMALTCLRWGIALALLSLFVRRPLRRDAPALRARWPYLLAMGGIGYALFNYFLYSALLTLPAVDVVLEQSAMPLIIFALSFAFFGERLRWLQLVGCAITMAGVLVVVSGGDVAGLLRERGGGLGIGDAFMLGAALCYGGYSVALRLKPQVHWLSFLWALVLAAFLVSLVALALEWSRGQVLWPTTLQGWLVVLYAGIFPSLVSQGFFIRGVEALGAGTAGLFINLVPVFGAVQAALLLGEPFGWYHVVSFALVAGGITLAQRTAGAR